MMRKLPIILGAILLSSCNNTPPDYCRWINENDLLKDEIKCKEEQIRTLKYLVRFEKATLAAIKQVESGDRNVVGDRGKAFGRLQIHNSCVGEVNRLYATRYKHKDAWDTDLAEEIFWLTMERAHFVDGDWDNMIQWWNGGPRIRNRQTKRYLKKVKSQIN